MAEHSDSIQHGLPGALIKTLDDALTEARKEGYTVGIEVGRSEKAETESANEQRLSDRRELGHREGATEQRNYFIGILKVLGEKHPDIVPDLPIDVLNLGLRGQRCLEREEIHNLGQLVLRDEDALLGIINFGQRCLDEVTDGLNQFDLSLRQDETS